MTVAFAVAIACLGYRLGIERGNSQWEQLGGSTSLGGGISVLTTAGCDYYDIDSSGKRTARLGSEESSRLNDPAADTTPFADVVTDDDPFR